MSEKSPTQRRFEKAAERLYSTIKTLDDHFEEFVNAGLAFGQETNTDEPLQPHSKKRLTGEAMNALLILPKNIDLQGRREAITRAKFTQAAKLGHISIMERI